MKKLCNTLRQAQEPPFDRFKSLFGMGRDDPYSYNHHKSFVCFFAQCLILNSLYVYAGNDPITNVDPDGRGFFEALAVAESAAVSAIDPAVIAGIAITEGAAVGAAKSIFGPKKRT